MERDDFMVDFNVFRGGTNVSFKTKLSIYFMLLVLIPLLIITIIGGKAFYDGYFFDMNERNTYAAAMKAKTLQEMLDMTRQSMVSLATTDEMRRMDVPKMNALLRSFQQNNPQTQHAYVTDLTGMQVARDAGKYVSIAERDYFKAIVGGKDVFYTDATLSKVTNGIIVVVSVPIKSEEGKVVGVFSATLQMKTLEEALNYDAGNAYALKHVQYLTDTKGNVMIHPDSQYVSQLTDWHDNAPVSSAMKGNITNLEYENAAGEECIGSSAPVEGVGWTVVVESKRSDAMENIYSLLLSIIGVAIVLLAIAFVVSKVIAGRETAPLAAMAEQSAKLAAGDLTIQIEINSDDEIGRTAKAFNDMADKMHGVVKHINIASEHLSNSAGSLTATAQQSAEASTNVAETISKVAEGMHEQSEAINSTKKAVDVFFGTIEEMTANTNKINAASDDTAKAAEHGSGLMQDAVSKMSSIEHSVTKTAETVQILGENSKAIGGIVDTIVAIADQTNLLALNAAIEAARAGDAGKGFAVVAEEVRKLAEESQKAAVEIKNKIESIQADTDNAINIMEAGRGDVQAGTKAIDAVGEEFKSIRQRIDAIKSQLNGFKVATDSIHKAASHIVDSVEKIDSVSTSAAENTETISAAAEEQSAATQEIASSTAVLEDLAVKLQKNINIFKL